MTPTKDERYEIRRLALRARGLSRAEKQALNFISDAQTMKDGVCRKALKGIEDYGNGVRSAQRGLHGRRRKRKDGTRYLEYPGLIARGLVEASGHITGGRTMGGEGLVPTYIINRDVLLTYVPETEDPPPEKGDPKGEPPGDEPKKDDPLGDPLGDQVPTSSYSSLSSTTVKENINHPGSVCGSGSDGGGPDFFHVSPKASGVEGKSPREGTKKAGSRNSIRKPKPQSNPPLEAFVAGLRAQRDGDGWLARCPHPDHEDSHPSLVISVGQNQPVVLKCRAGCPQSEVWAAALEIARGVSLENLQPLDAKAKPKKEFTATLDDVLISHAKLRTVPEVQSWLQNCGIALEIADKLQLGALPEAEFTRDDETKFKSPAVVTPHFNHAGDLVGLKARAVIEKAFNQEQGSSIAGLFAVAQLDPLAEEVLVLEGDKDVAIALSHGFNATGILSAGSGVPDADIAALAKYPRIYLIGDEDKAGIEAMDRLAKLLPEDRVIRVRLPVKDLGDLYQQIPTYFKDRLLFYMRGGADARDRIVQASGLTG